LCSRPEPDGKNLLTVNNNVMTVMQSDCALNDCWYVSKVSVNGASTERQRSVNDFSLILSAIKELHHHINPKTSYWPAFNVKRQAT